LKTTATTRPGTHQYVGDGIPDLKGEESCTCRLPRKHKTHDVPEVPEHVAADEARRLGEKVGE
jgi:hypothetical protein